MIKLLIIMVLFIFIIPFNCQLVAQKTKAFILYTDGTWEKVNEETTQQKSIEDIFTDFKKTVALKDKVKIMEFFKFPFELDITSLELNSKGESDCLRPICKIKGAISKRKLDDNFTLLFDELTQNVIDSVNSDEYTEGADFDGEKYFKFSGTKTINVSDYDYQKSRNIIKEGTISYDFFFEKVKNDYKIESISITVK